MHIRNLQVFCDVVRRRSFSKAAADNSMTQSGASQAVQQLEEYLQVQLLDRSKRPFLLTSEGTVFHVGCLQLLRQFEALTEEVRSIGRENLTGRASIAAIYSIGLSYLPELQRSIKCQHPKADVRYQFGQPDEVYRLVEQGIVDFGLVSYPESSKTILVTEWREETMVLAAVRGHALQSKAELLPEDLATETLVAFAPNLRIRHEIDRYLRHLGITMQVAAEFDNIDSVKHAMEVNSAVSFLPRPTVQAELTDRTMIELRCPWLNLKRPLGLIQRRNDTLGRTARGVADFILKGAWNQAPTTASSSKANPLAVNVAE
ncbi:LysR family transcriptional regulator [Aureliella helgolandensis]|uniref:HTH-type transcriptional regulator CysL n=1 Tax=Aureliella helgolandensis TaxID=2527968 RepID=A0A518GF63_9BACT|nr:LysR family transcriptional regulator [Aureliella helgolandensis]QDV27223.1 HTH-type transcriptional regulator CysL [Aureliella helgolandensis]